MSNPRLKDCDVAPGWGVAVTLRRPLTGLRCYVGEVQATSPRGLRITLVDWIIGSCTNYDLWIPWDNVDGLYLATDEHDLTYWLDSAAKWQTNHESAGAARG